MKEIAEVDDFLFDDCYYDRPDLISRVKKASHVLAGKRRICQELGGMARLDSRDEIGRGNEE